VVLGLGLLFSRRWRYSSSYLILGDRLMRDARAREFDAVLVARFDRFARSTKHLVTALEEFGRWL